MLCLWVWALGFLMLKYKQCRRRYAYSPNPSQDEAIDDELGKGILTFDQMSKGTPAFRVWVFCGVI